MVETITHIIADGAVIPVALIGIWALLFKVPKGHRYEAYSRIMMAGLMAYLFAKLIGAIYQPELLRPFEILGVKAGASFLNNPGFPSDHTLFCAAITLAVWFETRMKKTSILLAVLTIIVATGRVVALVHTPLDVIGGIVIAGLGALWYMQRDSPKKVHHIRQWSKSQKAGKI